eukprot:scaffold372034_cov32-Attheya_sp.AAC.3
MSVTPEEMEDMEARMNIRTHNDAVGLCALQRNTFDIHDHGNFFDAKTYRICKVIPHASSALLRLKAKIVSTRQRDYHMDAAAVAADAAAAAALAG